MASFCIFAPGRIRTYNNWSEASRDIHFTTGADYNSFLMSSQVIPE